MDRPGALMAEAAPHLDPGLTLPRLTRRSGAPAKQLSSAVNREVLRVTGMPTSVGNAEQQAPRD